MPLPININELLNGKTVEWERIEFREGWNPERTHRTICGFANDFNNWRGGYIVLDVSEKNGQPKLPPKGLRLNQIDSIQQELNNICRKIIPNYFPIVEPVDFQGKKILILWCPGGSNRPYKAPETLSEHSRYYYYIRRYSSTVQPTRDEERELLAMANQIPFDDRVNHNSTVNDFDLSTIKIFLNEIGSDLEKEITKLTINEIARRMNIAEGGNENLIPKNVGLLFFAKEPQKFFPSAKIEIITFTDESGSDYTEKTFTGPLHNQLKSALEYLKNTLIKEKVVKSPQKAESDRFFNYPYDALEEALCNAVYHRGYDNDSSIEARIYPSKIDIISFPGPLPPLDKERLNKLQFDVRKYRNRRIGEFLKELHLTEGRATGIPTIIKSLEKNKSPKPIFDTDEARSYFKTTIKSHKIFIKEREEKSISKADEQDKYESVKIDVLNKIGITWDKFNELVLRLSQACPKSVPSHAFTLILLLTRNEIDIITIMEALKQKNRTRFRNNFLKPMIENGFIIPTIPDKPQSPKQKYIITNKGKKLLENQK